MKAYCNQCKTETIVRIRPNNEAVCSECKGKLDICSECMALFYDADEWQRRAIVGDSIYHRDCQPLDAPDW
jgi:hypothetical protein